MTGSATRPGTATVKEGGPKCVTVKLTEFAIKPSTIDVAPGTMLTLIVTNSGAMARFTRPSRTKFSNVVKGALGLFQADEVKTAVATGHRAPEGTQDRQAARTSFVAVDGSAARAPPCTRHTARSTP